MYTVDVEHIFHLILAELFKFAGTDIIQVNKRNMLFFGYLLCPQSKSLVDTCDDGAVFVFPSIAGSKRKKDRMSTFGFYILNETTHIFPVGIYGFFYSGFFNRYVQCIFANSGNGSTGTSAVVWAVVIVPQFDDNPVSRAYSFDYIRP